MTALKIFGNTKIIIVGRFQTDTLWFFNDQVCRAMPLVYDVSIEQEGLPGLRFVPREDVFMSAERFPEENSCFAGNNRLSGDGVFDVTVCQFDTPIILSWPHFLGAEEKFTGAVTGLNPDKVSSWQQKLSTIINSVCERVFLKD